MGLFANNKFWASFVKMSLESCCICLCWEVGTIAIVCSPPCCGCSMCTELARAEVPYSSHSFECLVVGSPGTEIVAYHAPDWKAQAGMIWEWGWHMEQPVP